MTRILAPNVATEEPGSSPERTTEAEEEILSLIEIAKRERPLPALEGVQGVYFVPRGLFMGDIVSSTPGRARTHVSLVEGAEHLPTDPATFDADCVLTAMRYLTEGARATLFLPICYSNIIRASQREAFEKVLAVLPGACRNQLTASIYDTPRDPAFGGLALIRTMLTKYVANIDLQTHDPGFEVEKLLDGAVNSVTLVLPDSDRRGRLAVLRRFSERLDLYRRKRVWAAVTNVRDHAELEACVAFKIPFVTGAGVCRMQTQPMGGRLQPLDALPILAA